MPGKEELHIQALPWEITGQIFELLSDSDKKTASLVCKSWRDAVWLFKPKLDLIRRADWLVEHPNNLAMVLNRCSRLQKLVLPPTTCDHHLTEVGKLVSLRHLALRRARDITPQGFSRLSKLTNLQEICLSTSWNIDDGCMKTLWPMSGTLRSLEMRGCDLLTDNAMRILSEKKGGFPMMRYLDLRDCIEIGDDGVKYLVQACPNLTHLDLAGCNKVTPAGAAWLAKLQHLQTLILWGCEGIDDKAAEHLAKMSSLQRLNLYECRAITDLACVFLSCLHKLSSLEIGSQLITNKGLEAIARIPSLSTLALYDCKEGTNYNGILANIPKVQLCSASGWIRS